MLKWRWFDNLWPFLTYRLHAHPPSGESLRVLNELNEKGVALTSARRLFDSESSFEELKGAVGTLLHDRADEIAHAKASANHTDAWKVYLFELLGNRPELDPSSIYVRFALQKPILQIANAYFGMYTVLRLYNVWLNFPTQHPPRESQLWHRDPGDRLFLKALVYLSDVDDAAGPFSYVPRSHPKVGLRREPAFTTTKADRARRSDDTQMGEVLPANEWFRGVGPAGTIIFADTRGHHKGGYASNRDRLLYTCGFTSQATKFPELFTRPTPPIHFDLDEEQSLALSLSSRKR
jgi:hypothetical protein